MNECWRGINCLVVGLMQTILHLSFSLHNQPEAHFTLPSHFTTPFPSPSSCLHSKWEGPVARTWAMVLEVLLRIPAGQFTNNVALGRLGLLCKVETVSNLMTTPSCYKNQSIRVWWSIHRSINCYIIQNFKTVLKFLFPPHSPPLKSIQTV